MDGPPYATTNRDPDGHGPCIREEQTHKLKTSIQPSRERSPRAPLRHNQTVCGSESVICISEMVMYPKIPPQECPHYPAMYHSHGISIAVIHHPTPSCTMSHHPRKTNSLCSCKHVSHTDKYRTMYNHSPMWTDTPYLTHRNISTQFPSHTPTWSTYCYIYTEDMVPDRDMCAVRRHSLSPNHTNSTKQPSMPAWTPTHPKQPHCYRLTILQTKTQTQYAESPRVTDMQVTHKYRSHSLIHTPPQTHAITWCQHIQTHL